MCESCKNYRAFIHKLRNAYGQINQYGQIAALSKSKEVSPGTFELISASENNLIENINRFGDLLRTDPNEKV